MPDQYKDNFLEERDRETEIIEQDPLALDLDDDVLVNHINSRINDSETWFDTERDLSERRKRNLNYWLGGQVDEADFEYYQSPYLDNLIYEAENTIKPIALSRLPDLLAKPGSEKEESKKSADDLTKLINSDIRKRENRRVLGMAFKHLPIFFTGIIKPVWDPTMGKDGDYKFRVVHPDNVVVDHTAVSNNSDDMDFVAEFVELSVKEVIMRFPDQEKALLNILEIEAEKGGEKKGMASKIKISEVWFTWYDNAEDPNTEEQKWERIEAVVWKYKTLILAKMKNPYWDWEGEKRLFKYDLGKKREASEDEIRASMFGEEELEQDTIFHNHFEQPRKPYIFLGYDQLGNQPYDATSRIEQVILMQDNVNKRGRQITEMNDRARGKNVFDGDKIDKETVEEMDPADPNEDLVVSGDVRKAHTFIPGQPAPQQLYAEQDTERNKAFAKMGTHATTRGERQSDVATTNQILRESDFGRIDDIVEDTINYAAELMANWSIQFIKLFYTSNHMSRVLGDDGEITFIKINRDRVEDGMEVSVTASGVDKLQKKREALEMAKLGSIDPLNFFKDMGVSDPKGRTEALLMFQAEPLMYLQQTVRGMEVGDLAQTLQQQPIQGQQPGQPAPQGQAPQAATGGGGFNNFTNNQIQPNMQMGSALPKTNVV